MRGLIHILYSYWPKFAYASSLLLLARKYWLKTTMKRKPIQETGKPSLQQQPQEVHILYLSFEWHHLIYEFRVIKYTTPSCDECASLDLVWDRLASELSQDYAKSEIYFGQIDCLYQKGKSSTISIHPIFSKFTIHSKYSLYLILRRVV